MGKYGEGKFTGIHEIAADAIFFMALGALICKGAWLGVRLRNISAGLCELAIEILGLSTDLGCRVGVALAENSWGANGISFTQFATSALEGA